MTGKRVFRNRKRTKVSPSRTKRNGRLYTKQRCVSDETEGIRISSEREMSYSNDLIHTRTESMRTSTENRVLFFTKDKSSNEFFNRFFFIEFIYFYVPSIRDTFFRHSAKKKKDVFIYHTRRSPGSIIPSPTGTGNTGHQSRWRSFMLVSFAKKNNDFNTACGV